MLKIYVVHSDKNLIFYQQCFDLNVNNLIIIAHNLVKFSVHIFDMLMLGTVSQNFDSCSSFHFMSFRKSFLYIFQTVSRFLA